MYPRSISGPKYARESHGWLVIPSSAAISLLLFAPDARNASSLAAVSPFPSSSSRARLGGTGQSPASPEGAPCVFLSRSAFFPSPL